MVGPGYLIWTKKCVLVGNSALTSQHAIRHGNPWGECNAFCDISHDQSNDGY